MKANDYLKETKKDYNLYLCAEDWERVHKHMDDFANHILTKEREQREEEKQQAVIEALENVESKIKKHLSYFDNPKEWNQNDRFIQGRKKGFQNSLQTVQNEITKVRTK